MSDKPSKEWVRWPTIKLPPQTPEATVHKVIDALNEVPDYQAHVRPNNGGTWGDRSASISGAS